MERKIEEIFEYNGEWYQCIPDTTDDNCNNCFFQKSCRDIAGYCSSTARSDGKSVCFKKLEKVGEPFYSKYYGKFYQMYKTYIPAVGSNFKIRVTPVEYVGRNEIFIEIKQNKVDMEEKKLIELLSEKVHNAWMKEKEAQGFSYGKDYNKEKKKHPDMLPYNELKEEVKEYDRATVRAVLQAQKELQSKYNYNNLKSFDLEAAKAGKPVCTRDGRKARIICFDRIDSTGCNLSIVALIQCDGTEVLQLYRDDGKRGAKADLDLMMLPEKKEGWVNLYYDNDASSHRGCRYIYDTKERAVKKAGSNYITTVKIEWEE